MANHPPRRDRGRDSAASKRTLVLTLGALAELEAAFGADDLVALTERFGAGRLKARDLTRIIGAGLRGAGEAVSDDEVARDGGRRRRARLCAHRRRTDPGDVRRMSAQ